MVRTGTRVHRGSDFPVLPTPLRGTDHFLLLETDDREPPVLRPGPYYGVDPSDGPGQSGFPEVSGGEMVSGRGETKRPKQV